MNSSGNQNDHQPHLVELFKIAARWQIFIAFLGVCFGSLPAFRHPSPQYLGQIIVLVIAIAAAWWCLRLIRSGRIYFAARLLAAVGLVVGFGIIWTANARIFLGGIFIIAVYMMIIVLFMPTKESTFWFAAGIFSSCSALLMRFIAPLGEPFDSWIMLGGYALFAAAGLTLVIFLAHAISARLDSTHSEPYSHDPHAPDQTVAATAQQIGEEKCRIIFNTSPDFIYLTDVEGRLLDANPALLDKLGLSIDQIKDRNVWNFLSTTESEKLMTAKAMLQNGQAITGFEIEAKVYNDQVRNYDVNAVPMKKG